MVLDQFGVVNSTVWGFFQRFLIASVTVLSWLYVNVNFGLWLSSCHSICLFVCHLDNLHFDITFKLGFSICLTNLLTFTMQNHIFFFYIWLRSHFAFMVFFLFFCFRVARIVCYILLYYLSVIDKFYGTWLQQKKRKNNGYTLYAFERRKRTAWKAMNLKPNSNYATDSVYRQSTLNGLLPQTRILNIVSECVVIASINHVNLTAGARSVKRTLNS